MGLFSLTPVSDEQRLRGDGLILEFTGFALDALGIPAVEFGPDTPFVDEVDAGGNNEGDLKRALENEIVGSLNLEFERLGKYRSM